MAALSLCYGKRGERKLECPENVMKRNAKDLTQRDVTQKTTVSRRKPTADCSLPLQNLDFG